MHTTSTTHKRFNIIIKNYLSIYVNIFKEWEADPVRDC